MYSSSSLSWLMGHKNFVTDWTIYIVDRYIHRRILLNKSVDKIDFVPDGLAGT